MIIRHAQEGDAEQFRSFDVGGPTAWLDEVSEIVLGLLVWRSDPHAASRDRQVIVAVDGARVIGVTAHERIGGRHGPVWEHHRYLMVTAVQADQQRTGPARLLIESTFADLRASGCESVDWLVRPRNRSSIQFSRNVFPEADETQPPEDHPYVSFARAL